MARIKYTFLFLMLISLISCNSQEEVKQQTDPTPSDINRDISTDIQTQSSSSDSFLKIGILGDLNGSLGDPSYASSVTKGMKHILNANLDLILGTGDFTSGEDYKHRFPKSRFDEMWASFDKQILSPITKLGIPFAPTPGNHDANIERERGYYKTFWKNRIPKVQMISTEAYPFYYSFIFQNIFFISMDDVKTHKLYDRTVNGVTQRQWIINQLDSSVARSALARIVFGHVPIYPLLSKSRHASRGSGKYYEIMRNEQQTQRVDSLEEIFKTGKIDLAIFGHSHAYYPGVVQHKGESIEDSLNILQMACLGHGNRYLDQRTSARSQRGYAEVKVNLTTGELHIDSFNFNGELVKKSTLPKRIKPYSTVTIKRRDLAKLELQNSL